MKDHGLPKRKNGILKEDDAAAKVQDLCRKHGVSSPAYYKWKSKCGGLGASQLKQIQELDTDLAQYKKMYAELAHENCALKDLI